MQNTSKQLLEKTEEMIAFELGKLAFSNDIHAMIFDEAMQEMIKGSEVGEKLEAMKAWNRGHTVAMLAAPLPELA